MRVPPNHGGSDRLALAYWRAWRSQGVLTGWRRGQARALQASPQDTQDGYTPLIVEDEINDQALAMLADGVRTHIRIGALPIIGIAAPRLYL